MSHFTKIKTQISDIENLKAALHDLKYRFEEAAAGQKLSIKGFGDALEAVDLAVRTGSKYDIGFQWQQEAYQVVADWWGVENLTPIRQEAFTNQVTQRYAYHKTIHELEAHDFYVEEEEVNAEQVIVLTVKWYD
jgi:hypothetical protein